MGIFMRANCSVAGGAIAVPAKDCVSVFRPALAFEVDQHTDRRFRAKTFHVFRAVMVNVLKGQKGLSPFTATGTPSAIRRQELFADTRGKRLSIGTDLSSVILLPPSVF